MNFKPVLHSTPIWLGQTLTWLHSQVAELQKLGVDAHVVCDRTENLDQFGVANIHCLANEGLVKHVLDRGMRKFRIRRHSNYLVEIGNEVGAGIIHSHFGNVGWANLAAVRKLGIKHTVTFYGYDVNKLPTQEPIWRKRYQQMFEEADLFLCEGSHMAQCIIDLGCPANKVKVQHLGVDINQFEFKPRMWQPGETLKVLIAASFREKKGIPYAIKALGLLLQNVPIELTVIGDAGVDVQSQEEKKKILQSIEDSGLKANTRLLGYQTHMDMLKEAYAHHIFLHPSVTASDGDTEGGAPVSIIEMLATGMQVVSTNHCDIPEVMGEALCHLLAPEKEPMSLSQIMGALLQSYENWLDIARIGRARVEMDYDYRKQAIRLAEQYRNLL